MGGWLVWAGPQAAEDGTLPGVKLPDPVDERLRGARLALGAAARPVLVRITVEAFDRHPDRTVALVRARLERSSRRRPGEPLDLRTVVQRVVVRAIDVHPAVGRRLVRYWLRRLEATEGPRTAPAER